MKNMSNFWKKQGQPDINYNDAHIIRPLCDLPFKQEYYIYEGQIMPTTMIQKHEAYEITEIHTFFIMQGFCVSTENDLVMHVSLFGPHPNRDPDTGLFCLPQEKLNVKFSPEYFNKLLTTLKTYYLDNAYFTPPLHYVTYEKLKSAYIQLK